MATERRNATEQSQVHIASWPKEPVSVVTREPVPVCLKLCEPICARSEYTVGIDIFDRPVAAITIKGLTKLFGCDDKIS